MAPNLTLSRCSINNSYCYFLLPLFLCKDSYCPLKLILVALLKLFPMHFQLLISIIALPKEHCVSFNTDFKVLAASIQSPQPWLFWVIFRSHIVLIFSFQILCLMLSHLLAFSFCRGGSRCKCYTSLLWGGQENDPRWVIQLTVKDGLWKGTKSF